jgi:hypothetical protein
MTPEDISADLSARLRSQGRKFDPAALEAFAADLRDRPDGDRDIEALARRFDDWQWAVARARDRKRAKAWVEGACVAGIGSVISGIGALGVLCPIIYLPRLFGNTVADVTWFVVWDGIMAFGAVIVARGLISGFRASRRLAAEAESDAAS